MDQPDLAILEFKLELEKQSQRNQNQKTNPIISTSSFFAFTQPNLIVGAV